MENMVMIKTNSGFECSIDKDARDDMRIFEALIDIQSGTKIEQITALKTILDRLLGPEQKEALYKHAEEKHGRAGSQIIYAELNDIFEKMGEASKK